MCHLRTSYYVSSGTLNSTNSTQLILGRRLEHALLTVKASYIRPCEVGWGNTVSATQLVVVVVVVVIIIIIIIESIHL